VDGSGSVLVLGLAAGPVTASLEEAGYRVQLMPLSVAATRQAEELSVAGEPAAAVALDASCAPGDARALLEVLAAAPGITPPVLVVATDPEAAEPHLAAGLDVLLPPYTASVLRSRVESARELVRLSLHTQDLLAEAHRARMDKELQIGRDIQLGFLPSSLPERDGWDLAARFRPAREVAGDFYDGFEMVQGRRIGLVVADVCDKGVGAALFMALIRTLVRNGAQQNISMGWVDPGGGKPSKDAGGEEDWLPSRAASGHKALPSIGTGSLMNAVAGTNRYMTDNHLEQGYFATMFMAMLDPRDGSICYINGGHNPPAIVRADGTRVALPPSGPAVGMMPGVDFRIEECRLEPGDALFIYTDGVPEAKDEHGKFFGEDRMSAVLAEPVVGAVDLLDRMDVALRGFVGDAAPFDDITMMAVRRLPSS
jgi:sigma-B regulation protein RsbU (phosphoserine phosphatase)